MPRKVELIEVIEIQSEGEPREIFRTETELKKFVDLARQLEGPFVIEIKKLTPAAMRKAEKAGSTFA